MSKQLLKEEPPNPSSQPNKIRYVHNPDQFLVASGLLFEINRRILHPLGLALAVELNGEDEKKEQVETSTVIRIWDNRDDPEGIYFENDCFGEGEIKFAKTLSAAKPRFETRREKLGYVVQNDSSLDETARLAYSAYGFSMGWMDSYGSTMCRWEELSKLSQQAWKNAVRASVEP